MEASQVLSNYNIRGYTEKDGLISLDALEKDKDTVENGFSTHWSISHFFLNFLGASQAVHFAANKVVYVDVESFNEWKNRNYEKLSELIGQEILTENKIEIIVKALQNTLTEGWGIDRENHIYRIKRSKDGSDLNEVDYSLGCPLGDGLSGEVRVLLPNVHAKSKAIKICKLKTNEFETDYAEKEHRNLKEIPKNATGLILPLKAYFPQQGVRRNGMLIMPQYDGVLDQILFTISSEEKNELISQLIKGLSILHKQNICHRDLKVSNVIFCKKNGSMRYDLCDLGISSKIKNQKDIQTDIFLLGCLLRDIIDPKNNRNNFFSEEKIEEYLRNGISKSILDFMEKIFSNKVKSLEEFFE